MQKIPSTHVETGQEVFSLKGCYLGKVSRVFSTIFYAIDKSGNESGYCSRFDRDVLIQD
jgi:hypothetical protein